MAKRIFICFDGTSNHPRNAKQEREWFGSGEIKDNGITNVLKLHAMLGGNLMNEPSHLPGMAGQHSLYYSGVGTYGSKIQRMFNAGFASSNQDIRTIMYLASEDLKKTYEDGDKLIVIGFSRGAAIARKFASRLRHHLPAIADKDPETDGRIIELMAVFDTVASIGIPNLDDDDKPTSDVVFEDGVISPHIEQALHLLSIDDRRTAFHPTLMCDDGRATEVWFPGAHSDVGGGFWRDGLSDIALKFTIAQILKRTSNNITIRDPGDVDFDHLRHEDEYQIDFEDLDIKPNVKSESHEQDRWAPVSLLTLRSREPRVEDACGQPKDKPVLIHKSVFDRINEVVDYRPKALKGVKHHIIDDDGSTIGLDGAPSSEVFNGLFKHVS